VGVAALQLWIVGSFTVSHKAKHKAVVARSTFWAVIIGALADKSPEWLARFIAELIRRMNE
jgi:hypothetical protein